MLQAAGISGCFVGVDPGVAQQPLEETMPRTRRLSDSPPLRREANVMVDDLASDSFTRALETLALETPKCLAMSTLRHRPCEERISRIALR